MRIRTVEYRQLKSFGNYNNEVVGAVAEVDDHEAPEDALATLKGWVGARIGASEQVADAQEKLCALEQEQRGLESDISRLKKVYQQLVKLLKKHGVKVSDRVPF